MTMPADSDPAQLLPANARLRRSRRLWRVLFFLVLAVAVVGIGVRYGLEDANPLGERIARVIIDGTISTDPARLKVLKEIGDNAQVKGVIVAINSPGGTTAGGEELYEALAALRAKKPVVTVIKELGASAAYMTAIGADRIFARRLSIVGSIGVLFQTVNAQKLMETIGVDLDKVASGPLKAEPDLDEPMSPEVRASIQQLVNDSFNWFVDVVAERRGIDRNTALALADGRILTGRMALDDKLIDAIGGESEAQAWLESDKGVAHDLPVATAYPPPDTGEPWFWRLIGGEMRGLLGLPAQGPIALDGLVSLWQGQPSL
jgi:protease-4